jgi:hypothetical protein
VNVKKDILIKENKTVINALIIVQNALLKITALFAKG